MKKLFSLMTAMILCIGAIHAADTKIYCKVAQAWWNADGAAVAAYAWSGEGETAVTNAEWPGARMTPVEEKANLWEISLDLDKYENVIFVRVSGEGELQNWGAQTADLRLPKDDKVLYTITSETAAWAGEGQKVEGAWSKLDDEEGGEEDPKDPTVVVKSSLDEWASEFPFILAEDKKSASLSLPTIPMGDINFKLIVNGEWRSNGREFSRKRPGAAGITGNLEANMVLKADAAGKYTLTWTFANDSLGIEFPEKGEEDAPSVSAKGSWDEWANELPFVLSEDKASASLTAPLHAGTYDFKLIVNGEWRSNGMQFSRDKVGAANIKDNNEENMKVVADVEGNYTVTWTFANDSLGIKFPDKPVDPEAAKFYVTGDSAFVVDALAGLDKKWAPDAIKTTDYILTLTLKGGQDYKMKVTLDGTWNTAKGYSDLSNPAKGLSTDEENNICFKLEGEGPQDIVIEYGEDAVFKVAGKFYVEPVDPEAPKFYIAGTMTDWEKNKIAVNEDQYLLDLGAGDHKLKIIVGENWIGYQKLSVVTKGLSTDKDDNICFTLAEAGKVKVTYNGADFIVDGNFYVKPDNPEAAKFYITGSKELVGEEKAWKADAIAVSEDSYTFEKLPAGDYQLKVTLKGAWEPVSDVLGFDALTEVAEGLSKDADGNICFTLAEASDVTVTYGLGGAGSVVFKLEGNFYVEPVVIDAKFYITGDAALVGEEKAWKPNAIAVSEDSYTLKALAVGEYKMKITIDGTWATAKGYDDLSNPDENIKKDGDGNIVFYLSEAGDVTVTYAEGVLTLDGKFGEMAVDPDVKFYIAGSMTDWEKNKIAVKDDRYLFNLEAGDYKLKVITIAEEWKGYDDLTEKPEGVTKDADGNICFTLAEDGQVILMYTSDIFTLSGNFYVKPEDELSVSAKGAWDEWGLELNFEVSEDKKSAVLNIPLLKGEYEFKLIVNGDWRSNGYTFHRESVGAAGITENAEANMVLNADVDGEYTITWTFENDSLGITFPEKDEPITDKVILYVVLHIDWEKVFAYAWSEEGEKNAEWPGVELKKFIAGEKPVPSRVRAALQAEDEVVYIYECPKELANVIFNNGIVGEGAEQTSDLTWEEEKPVFVIDSEKNDQGKYDGEWTAETPTALNIVTDDTKAVKVLYNGNLYILRAGKVYNFQGQLVK